MSHYSDSSEKQQQLSRSKKRSRWNDEEPDAGEILESDDTMHNQGHFDHSSETTGGTKRLRPSQESSKQHSSSGVVEPTKKSRDELDRERQIRMAALRAETEEDGHPNDHDPTVSQPPDSTASTKKKQSHRNDDDPEEEEDDDAKMMQELFGIRQFGSSKNTKVATNHTSAAIGTIAKHLKPRKYRQYMNRKNGFNRPLDNI